MSTNSSEISKLTNLSEISKLTNQINFQNSVLKVSYNVIQTVGTSLVIITLLGAGVFTGLVIPVAIGAAATSATQPQLRKFVGTHMKSLLSFYRFTPNKVNIYEPGTLSVHNLKTLNNYSLVNKQSKVQEWLTTEINGKTYYSFPGAVYAGVQMISRIAIFGVMAAFGTIQIKVLSPLSAIGNSIYEFWLKMHTKLISSTSKPVKQFFQFIDAVMTNFSNFARKLNEWWQGPKCPTKHNKAANMHAIKGSALVTKKIYKKQNDLLEFDKLDNNQRTLLQKKFNEIYNAISSSTNNNISKVITNNITRECSNMGAS